MFKIGFRAGVWVGITWGTLFSLIFSILWNLVPTILLFDELSQVSNAFKSPMELILIPWAPLILSHVFILGALGGGLAYLIDKPGLGFLRKRWVNVYITIWVGILIILTAIVWTANQFFFNQLLAEKRELEWVPLLLWTTYGAIIFTALVQRLKRAFRGKLIKLE
ncbi:MAG: hypothetical protein AAF490_28835 [Chloroflexota bacterium]